MEPESSSPYSQAPAIRPYPEPTPSSLHPLLLPEDPSYPIKCHFSCCVIPPLEKLPLGDPSRGVVYLRIVLSPEEASRLVNIS